MKQCRILVALMLAACVVAAVTSSESEPEPQEPTPREPFQSWHFMSGEPECALLAVVFASQTNLTFSNATMARVIITNNFTNWVLQYTGDVAADWQPMVVSTNYYPRITIFSRVQTNDRMFYRLASAHSRL